MDWISVDDRLPKGGLVLIISDCGLIAVGSHEIKSDGPCWRIGNDFIAWDYDYNYDFTVDSWAEIELPRG